MSYVHKLHLTSRAYTSRFWIEIHRVLDDSKALLVILLSIPANGSLHNSKLCCEVMKSSN